MLQFEIDERHLQEESGHGDDAGNASTGHLGGGAGVGIGGDRLAGGVAGDRLAAGGSDRDGDLDPGRALSRGDRGWDRSISPGASAGHGSGRVTPVGGGALGWVGILPGDSDDVVDWGVVPLGAVGNNGLAGGDGDVLGDSDGLGWGRGRGGGKGNEAGDDGERAHVDCCCGLGVWVLGIKLRKVVVRELVVSIKRMW